MSKGPATGGLHCVRPPTPWRTYRVKVTDIFEAYLLYPRRIKPALPAALARRVRRVVCFAFLGMISEKGSHILVARAFRWVSPWLAVLSVDLHPASPPLI